MPRARKQPIPVTIVAGLTGAGKTTLVNRLLKTRPFADSAVILNDFGEVALEGAAVETVADGYIALGSGCVCCSIRGALTDGLENLLRDLDNGRVAAIGRVVIEADAIADPAAILGAIARHPYLSLRFAPDGIVAVLDGTTAGVALGARADTVRQIAMADVIAVSRGMPAGLAADLASLNPHAPMVDAAIAPAAVFVDHGDFDPATGDIEAWLRAGSSGDQSRMEGEAARVTAFSVSRNTAIPLAALDRLLEYLSFLQAQNLIRVRGVVAVSDVETVIVNGIGGFFYPPVILDRVMTDGPAIRFSVVARDLPRATFEGYIDAFLNEARIDTPDRAAIVDNPLAIAGFSARRGS
jgi:G3E family GTPase